MAAALVPPSFDEAEDTDAPLTPPAFDEAQDTDAPMRPPSFEDAEDIPAPAAPTSSPTGDFIKRVAASTTQATMQIGRGLLYADERLDLTGLGKLSKAVFGPADPKDLMRKEVVRFAADVQEAAPAELGVDPAREGTIPSKLAGAAGSVIPIVASGGLAPIAAGAMMGESNREEAEAAGASEAAQLGTFALNAGVGVVSEFAMGLPALLRSAKAVSTVGKGAARQITEQVVKGAAREGAQEGVEQIGQNLIAKGIYDPNRGLMEGVPQSIALGAAVGGPLGGTVQAAATVDAQRAGELKTGIEQDVAALGLTPEEQSVPEVVDTRLDKTNEFLRQTPSEQVAPTTEPLPPAEPQTQPDPNQPPPVPPKEAPPAAPADPNDYVVQLKIGDELVEGGPDDNHKSLFERYTADMDKSSPEYEAAVLAFADDSAHVFKNTKDPSGKALSRDELATALGESRPVQSERLRVLKAEWAAKATSVNTAPSTPQPQASPVQAEAASSQRSEIVAQAKEPPPLSDGPYKSKNEEGRAYKLAQGFIWNGEKWIHPDYPGASTYSSDVPAPKAAAVQAELQKLRGESAEKTKPVAEPEKQFGVGEYVSFSEPVIAYKSGKPFTASTKRRGKVVSVKPNGDLEIKLISGGYATKKVGEIVASPSEPSAPAPETKPAPAQPPPVPPKAAPPSVPAAPSDQSPTGIRNAVVDKERVERGLPERMAPLRRSFGKLWDEAMARVDKDAQAGPKLVAEIAENPRPLEDWESALLAHEQVTRQNAFDKAVADVNANPGNAEAAAALTTVRNEVQEIYDAGQKAGTKSGQSLAARKLLVNDDYTLAKMEAVTRAVVNDGKPLTAQQASEVAALHKRIAETEKKLAEYESKETERASQDAFANLLKELKSEAKAEAKSGKTLTDFLDTQADKARARIRKRSGALNIGINPAELADHVIIGSSWIAKGITKLADFTARMVKEFGEAIRPHLPDIFSKAKDYHAANASLFGRSTKPQKSAVEAAKANAAAGKPLSEGVVFDLAREKVRGGAVGLDAVMKAVHAELEPLHPGLTEREVRDAFSGYGKTKFPSKEADLVALRELRRLGQLVSAIEDAQSKQAPKKSGMQRDDPTQAIREKVKELHEAMKANGIETTSPEQQLKSSNAARATALRNQIADLDKQLATGMKPTKGSPAPDTPEVETLRAERDAMKEKLAEIEAEANPPRSPDEIRLEADKKAIATRTRKLQEKIAANDYTRPVKKEPRMDREKADLLVANEKAKAEFKQGLFEAEQAKRTKFQKAKDAAEMVLQSVRGIILGSDIGVLTRQGLFAWSRPIKAIRATAEAFKAAMSPASMARWELKNRLLEINGKLAAPIRKAAGLQTTDTLNHPEELVVSRLLSRIPDFNVGGRTIRLSVIGKTLERFQTTFINAIRTDFLDAAIRQGMSPDELKLRANFINSATGRSNIKYIPRIMSAIFTSPRYEASRWEMLAQPVRNLGALAMSGTRGNLNKAALANLQDMAIVVAGIFALFKLAKDAAGYEVNWDPKSSDFLKMRKGNEVWDVSAGLAPRIRDLMRIYVAVTHPSYKNNVGEALLKAGLRTINPAVRTPIEQGSVALQRHRGVSKPILPFSGFRSDEEREGWIALAPLIVQSTKQSLKEDQGQAAFTVAREFVGSSVNRYPKPKDK